jgi:hypothetical protein
VLASLARARFARPLARSPARKGTELGQTDVVYTTYTFGYLASDDAEEETEITGLPPSKFRIKVGGEGAPASLDEALLIKGGGERVVAVEAKKSEVDDATGMGGWDTVEERTITVAQHDQERRAERDAAAKEERAAEEMRVKEGKERQMEMAKYDNKDDSALGSFNVWGGSGYKGVDITGDRVVAGNEREKEGAGESGGGGAKVAFKKRKKKA